MSPASRSAGQCLLLAATLVALACGPVATAIERVVIQERSSGDKSPNDGSPGRSVPDLGVTHIRPGEAHKPYNSDPPTSGAHWPTLEAWGVYRQTVVPEQQVHYLEHGGIILHYKCQCPEEVEALIRLVRGHGGDRLILHPYPGMDTRFALTGWARIDKFNDFDESRFRAFIDAYRGRLGREARDPLELPIRGLDGAAPSSPPLPSQSGPPVPTGEARA